MKALGLQWARVAGRSAALPWLGAVVLALALPWVFSSSAGLMVLAQMGVAIVACLSLNVLLGQTGLLSFGHALFVGAGAYAGIDALERVGLGQWSLPVALVPLWAGLVALALALAVGGLAVRRGGTAFAMITLALGELAHAAALMGSSWSGGEAGRSANRAVGPAAWGITWGPAWEVYHLVAVYVLASAGALFALPRTPLGQMCAAVRDNARRVAFLGVDPRRVRLAAFAVAGFFAGVAGGLAALVLEVVTPEVLSAQRSGAYLLFTVLGGTAHFVGPVVGGVLLVGASVLGSQWMQGWLLVLGVGFVAVVLAAPDGLAGMAARALAGVRQGRLRGRGLGLVALAASAALALGAAGLLLEMAYVALRDGAGWLRVGPLRLDVGAAGAWVGVAWTGLTGAVLWAAVHAQWKRHDAL